MNIRVHEHNEARLAEEAARMGLSPAWLANDIIAERLHVGVSSPRVYPGYTSAFDEVLASPKGDPNSAWAFLFEVGADRWITAGCVVEGAPGNLLYVACPNTSGIAGVPRHGIISWVRVTGVPGGTYGQLVAKAARGWAAYGPVRVVAHTHQMLLNMHAWPWPWQ